MNETMIVLVTDQALPACPIIPSISSQGRTLKPSLQPTTSTESFFFKTSGSTRPTTDAILHKLPSSFFAWNLLGA